MSLRRVAFVLLMVIIDVPTAIGQTDCMATNSDPLGNSYSPNSPMGKVPFMVCNNTPTDDRLFINGTVVSTLCVGIQGVELELWQTNSSGGYSQGDNWSCRTKIQTDPNGRFNFSTVMPGREVDSSGNYLPANIHFRVNAPNGYNELITALYFRGDLYLAPSDLCKSCRSIDPSLTIQLSPFKGDIKTWAGEWQIVLQTKSSSNSIADAIIGQLKPIADEIKQEAAQKLPMVAQQAGNIIQNIFKRPGR